MPLTFIDIERQKNWRIALFFSVLLLVYLAVLAAIGAVFLAVPLNAAPRFWVFAVLAALLTAAIHFWFSSYDTVHDVPHAGEHIAAGRPVCTVYAAGADAAACYAALVARADRVYQELAAWRS